MAASAVETAFDPDLPFTSRWIGCSWSRLESCGVMQECHIKYITIINYRRKIETPFHRIQPVVVMTLSSGVMMKFGKWRWNVPLITGALQVTRGMQRPCDRGTKDGWLICFKQKSISLGCNKKNRVLLLHDLSIIIYNYIIHIYIIPHYISIDTFHCIANYIDLHVE